MGEWEITRLTDEHNCDVCGLSYDCGYLIKRDGVVVLDKTPFVTCTGGTNYYSDDPYKDILELMGVSIKERQGE